MVNVVGQNSKIHDFLTTQNDLENRPVTVNVRYRSIQNQFVFEIFVGGVARIECTIFDFTEIDDIENRFTIVKRKYGEIDLRRVCQIDGCSENV